MCWTGYWLDSGAPVPLVKGGGRKGENNHMPTSVLSQSQWRARECTASSLNSRSGVGFSTLMLGRGWLPPQRDWDMGWGVHCIGQFVLLLERLLKLQCFFLSFFLSFFSSFSLSHPPPSSLTAPKLTFCFVHSRYPCNNQSSAD